MEKGRGEWGLDSWPGSGDRWLARPAELEPQGGMGEGRGHLAPIPALWGEVDLPSKEGRPRRPQPAPPRELASRFGVAGGTRASQTASAHLVPFPERQPSFSRPQGPPPGPVGGPGWSRTRTREGVGFESHGPRRSPDPPPGTQPPMLPLLPLTVQGVRAPGGCHGAVGAAAGVGARTWGAAAGTLAHASEVRSSSGEGPVFTAVERESASQSSLFRKAPAGTFKIFEFGAQIRTVQWDASLGRALQWKGGRRGRPHRSPIGGC